MKVWTLAPREGWIVDRMVDEWNAGNRDITTSHINEADIVWLLGDWAWNQISRDILERKKVVTTVHHIVPEKESDATRRDFDERDKVTDVYHVFNERALQQVRERTMKPIVMVPYWANQMLWHRTPESNASLRARLGVPNGCYVVMSAQRDTEGHDLVSPKLEKGPDLFANAVIELHRQRGDVHVLLGGWRRQFVISRLKDAGVPFTYVERHHLNVVRDMYQVSDLYLVTARHEGGPQSLIECGLMGLPCVSTPVGIAEQVLPTNAINENVLLATPAVPSVEHMKLPHGFDGYRKMFTQILQSA